MARQFRFSLEKVLEYRSQLEDQARLALAEAQHVLRDHEAYMASLERTLEEQRASLSSGSATPAELWLVRTFVRRLEEDQAQAVLRRETLAQDVQTRREELTQRAKERKLLEKLKETQAAKHGAEENRKEQAGFDEMATLRYQRPAF